MIGDWITESTIIMLGCSGWTNARFVPGSCPACKGGILPGHDTRYCAVCDSLSPRREAQVRAARRGIERLDLAEQAEKKALDRLSRYPTVLTERERRQLWNGYRGGILAACEGLTNLSRAGRKFLARVGQCPDWSLILDGRGRVIGRTDEDLCP